jgi:hypothetical protein|tara:strand:- start:373 stop:567 length:195 start_codon:yes stop_codon:yes gene_type:complete
MILLNTYEVTNIKYDTDDEEIDLPKLLNIEVPSGLDEEETDEYVSDKISEETGFCHKGFSMRRL